MEHSYRFRIYPTKEQTIQIQRTFGCCRFVYNYYLAKRIDAYKSDKTTLGYKACSADMTALKKQLPWLGGLYRAAIVPAGFGYRLPELLSSCKTR